MSSLRQTPPPDRTPAYVALAVSLMLVAGAIGWIAGSQFNSGRPADSRDRVAQKSPTRQPDDQDSAASESGTPISKNGAEESGGPGSAGKASPVGKKPLESRTEFPGQLDPAAAENVSMGTHKDQSGLQQSGLQQGSQPSPPRLSDLSSYRSNSKKKRARIPIRGARQTGGQGPVRDDDGRGNAGAGVDSQKSKTRKVGQQESSATSGSGKTGGNPTSGQNRYAIPNQKTDYVFYQELIIDRNPVFVVEGLGEMKQQFKYRVISRMTVHPSDSGGFRKVSQKVTAANLISADSVSRESIRGAVAKLVGKEFRFTLDRKQKLVDFDGKKDPPKSVDFKDLALDGLKGKGMMMTSVMDFDGWREMAQLTFLLPDDKKPKWKDQMEHDWQELGRWVGETRFEKKNSQNGRLRIDYAHWMRYEPPAAGKGTLPFKIDGATFKSDEAGGRMMFDLEKRRIDSLVERFRVAGTVSVSMLGSPVKMAVRESQAFELRLHDQQPGTGN